MKQRPHLGRPKPGRPSFGLARTLSKLGYCSRSQARVVISDGRVWLNGAVCRDPEQPVDSRRDRIEVDGKPVQETAKVYLMLNKPRGLVTTASDEQGRHTVFDCLGQQKLPFVGPVGRLDMASEGLLLFTNDTEWAARITDPASHLDKTYHVQVGCIPDDSVLERLRQGIQNEGERLSAKRVSLLRHGDKNSWLEIVLDEGKNRQIRRLLAGVGVGVLRLIRIAIGPLHLGNLPKGKSRLLGPSEVNALAGRAAKG